MIGGRVFFGFVFPEWIDTNFFPIEKFHHHCRFNFFSWIPHVARRISLSVGSPPVNCPLVPILETRAQIFSRLFFSGKSPWNAYISENWKHINTTFCRPGRTKTNGKNHWNGFLQKKGSLGFFMQFHFFWLTFKFERPYIASCRQKLIVMSTLAFFGLCLLGTIFPKQIRVKKLIWNALSRNFSRLPAIVPCNPRYLSILNLAL